MSAIWLDVSRCTGCGACVEVCPTGALKLVNGKAQLNEALCKGCEACVQACPVGALQPVLEIEPVPIMERVPAYTTQAAPVVRRENKLAEVITAGSQLIVQVAPLVLPIIRGLLPRPRTASTGLEGTSRANNISAGVWGRQRRRRYRGGR